MSNATRRLRAQASTYANSYPLGLPWSRRTGLALLDVAEAGERLLASEVGSREYVGARGDLTRALWAVEAAVEGGHGCARDRAALAEPEDKQDG